MSKQSTSTKSSKPRAKLVRKASRDCPNCTFEFPINHTGCPHCGMPSFFPNVDRANDPIEKEKLELRLKKVRKECTEKDCEDKLDSFIKECSKSQAVFGCRIGRLFREIGTETQVYETYHDLERLKLRCSAPPGLDWGKLRPQAETELLGGDQHPDKIHYACLSLDGTGISSYGECVITLNEPMIAHRSTCFEGNTAVIYSEHKSFEDFVTCEWAVRGDLCGAVLGKKLNKVTQLADFQGILVEDGASPLDDLFIEVHVFGSMTGRTFQKVSIDSSKHSKNDKIYAGVVKEKFDKANVTCEIVG